MDTEQQSQQASSGGEFEREPVPKSALLGFKSFIGMYAGEHCAGTELTIGPLFVAAGVSAYDLVVGLLLGNALAVLSWMAMCAPIATRARLTLYFQLEKICGRKLVTLYNLANGVMFCFLAGAMVTVSATALGVWFKFPMPALNDLYPNSVGWVVAVAVIGGLISIVAAFGYQTVAKFANIAAPWMVLVFLAFGLVGLRQFIDATNTEIHSLGDVWTPGPNPNLEGRRSSAGSGEVHLLACHVLLLVLQYGDAYRHERPVGFPLRKEELVCRGLRLGYVRRPFHGLDERGQPLRVPVAPGSDQHGCPARSTGLSGRRYRRPDLRHHRRLDHRQSDHLSRRSGLPGPGTEIVAFQGDVGDRRPCDDCGYVSRPSP